MQTRQCGYCRGEGHRKPECPLFLEQRQQVLTHTPAQRKALIEGLGAIGLGIGAMFKTEDWYNNSESIGMIKDFSFVEHTNFFESKTVKYSKQVRLKPLTILDDYIYRRVYIQYLRTGDGSTQMRNIGISMTRSLAALRAGQDPFAYNHGFAMLSPSHEIDYDPEILIKGITMPRRLCLTKELHNQSGFMGIAPQ